MLLPASYSQLKATRVRIDEFMDVMRITSSQAAAVCLRSEWQFLKEIQ